MEWLLLGTWLILIVGIISLYPELVAPRCPICGAHLERRDDIREMGCLKRWCVGLRKFSCPACLYSHRRPILYRRPGVSKYETRAIH